MVIAQNEMIAFLKQSHLFQGLDNDALSSMTGYFRQQSFSEGKVIFSEGDYADALIFIFSGRVKITRWESEEEHQLAILVKGDYIGEGVMRGADAQRNATAKAVGNVSLLTLNKQDLEILMKQHSRFKKNLIVSVKSRRLAHKLRFKWVRDDEVVHFVVRKHYWIFIRGLIIPSFLGIIGIILLIYGIQSFQSIYNVSGAVFLFISLLWAIWIYLDWGNDYYIVTNQRVVWQEKIIGLYDSSVESPLKMIRNENVETSLLGRMLDFGDLIVYTFIGQIVFHNIPHPYEARIYVDEQRARIQEVVRAEEVSEMKEAIRSRIFPDENAQTSPVPFSPFPSEEEDKESSKGDKRHGIFSLRFEEKDTITYRKHIFVLFRQAGFPALMCICLLAVLGVGIADLLASSRVGVTDLSAGIPMFLVWFAAFLLFLGWTVYQYVDWSNDIFQVSEDQIYDIDKKPLGSEQRKSAPLENILSIESQRKGLLQLIFNYGMVYIAIGKDESLVFENVLDPGSVKQDIDRRRLASIARRDEARKSSERDRLADFFADFYRSQDEYQKDEEASPDHS